jgi:hypothetical protein
MIALRLDLGERTGALAVARALEKNTTVEILKFGSEFGLLCFWRRGVGCVWFFVDSCCFVLEVEGLSVVLIVCCTSEAPCLDLKVNDAGAAALARALEKNKTLRTLEIKVDDAGAAAFARALEKNTTLQKLKIRCSLSMRGEFFGVVFVWRGMLVAFPGFIFSDCCGFVIAICLGGFRH